MNDMKKKYISLTVAAFAFVSCSGFLDVNPKGEVFDKDMFESAQGYENSLYGIYAELGTENYLYKNYLHWVPEVLSCNVKTSDDALQSMSYAIWTKSTVGPVRKGMWAASYTAINHINNILAHIETGGEEQFRYTKLYKGEALALRALVHFELLRLYGAPVWASDDAKARAIPYVTNYSFDITPFSSLDEAYSKIIDDLKLAESLLAEDETLLPEERDNASGGGFASCRIIHMNLYAVQALLARVYWSRNDLENAAVYAYKVIESQKFRMRPVSAFNQPDNGTLDLDETIFGFYSRQYQEENAKRYGLSGSASSSTFNLADDFKSIYEVSSGASQSDLRYAAWFDDGQSLMTKLVNRIYYSSDASSYTGKSILGINLIRLPEMYYIMAESLMATDQAKASEYLDVVLGSRGRALTSESGDAITQELLFEERRREFYGEGFLWHDMKRLGKDIRVDASTTLPGNDVDTYKIPYPQSEDDNRNE